MLLYLLFFQSLMLPIELESNMTTNFRQKVEIPSCLELKELLKLAPEIIADESWSEKKIKEGENCFLDVLGPILLSFTQVSHHYLFNSIIFTWITPDPDQYKSDENKAHSCVWNYGTGLAYQISKH